jgi:hypothetical protein
MMCGRVQVRDRFVSEPDVGRGRAFLEAVAGKEHFPRPPGPPRSGMIASEEQFPQDVPSMFHRVLSSSQGVRIVSCVRGVRPGVEATGRYDGREVRAFPIPIFAFESADGWARANLGHRPATRPVSPRHPDLQFQADGKSMGRPTSRALDRSLLVSSPRERP